MICIACTKPLVPVWGARESTHCQVAMKVEFSGGYEIFVDSGVDTAVICCACAERVCEVVPWIGRLLECSRTFLTEDQLSGLTPVVHSDLLPKLDLRWKLPYLVGEDLN